MWLRLAGAQDLFFPTFVLPQLALTLGLGFAYLAVRRRFSQSCPQNGEIESRGESLQWRPYSVIFIVVVLCAILEFAVVSFNKPHGDFDAISTWNLRARFLAGGAAHWRDAFVNSKGNSRANLDYPLLLPATIASFWKYVGSASVLAPMLIAFSFTFSSAGLVWASLTFLRNKHVGFLGGIVLLSVFSFVDLGASQYADVAVGLFMLAAIAMLAIFDAAPNNQRVTTLVLAGAAAGFCAWTKNEGQLFLVVLLAVRFISLIADKDWKSFWGQATAIMCGVLPVLAVIAYFKLAVAPVNSWVSQSSSSVGQPIQYFLEPGSVAQKLTDTSRYWVIAKAMFNGTLKLGGRTIGITPLLLLYFIFAKVRRNSLVTAKTGMLVLGLTLAGYFFVYLVTPLELTYHLRTSLGRLLLQLWPSAVFVFFMAASPAQPLAFQSYGIQASDES